MDIKHNDKQLQYWANYDLNIVYAGVARLGSDWYSQDACAPFTRIYYISEGEGYIGIGNERIQMTAGNVYIIPAGTKFGYSCDVFMQQIFFHVNVMNASGLDILQECEGVYSRSIPHNKIHRILQLFESDELIDAFRLKGILWEEISEVLAESTSWQKWGRKYSELVERFFRLAQAPVNITNNVSYLAKQLGVSTSMLRKKFQLETAMTPKFYLQQLVIRQACYLLIVDEGRIADVAEKLGFEDQFYFTKFFQRHMNITPSEYRKKIQLG